MAEEILYDEIGEQQGDPQDPLGLRKILSQKTLKIDSVLESNKNKPFVDRMLNPLKYPSRENKDGSISTHKMAWGESDGKYVVYPTLFVENNKIVEPKDPFAYARKNNDFISFDKQSDAKQFAEGAWKNSPKINKGSKTDPLGLRNQYQQAPVTKKASAIPTVDWSKPVFEKLATESTSIQPSVTTQRAEAANYKPTQTVLGKFIKQITGAQEKVYKELTENDDVLESIVRNERANAAQRQQIDEYLATPRSDMPSVQNPVLQIDQRMPKEIKPQDLPVTSDDIKVERNKVATDEQRARNVLEEVARKKPQKKNEIQAAIYQLDMANAIQHDPEGGKRVIKAQDNAAKLERGELLYDWRQGRLYKPENIFQSFVTGWKDKNQLYSDYEKFRKIENNDAIAMELDDRRARIDPDDPLPMPEGMLGTAGSILGGTPAKVYAATALGGLAGPEGAMAAGAGVSALESYKLGWANAFNRAYYDFRNQGMDGFQAVTEARKLADKSATTDAIVGGVAGLIGARIAFKPIPKAALTEGFKKSVVNSLKGYGSVLKPALKEGLLAGGIGAAGESYKNELAIEAGLPRDADENVLQAAEANLLMPLAIGALVGVGRKLGATTRRHLLHGLSKADEGSLNNTISEAVQSGIISEEQGIQVKNDIDAFKKEDITIPANVAPEARVEILDKISKRKEYEAQLETLDKAYHPEIKEKIKGIDERITELSKEKVKITAEENKVNNLINEAVEEGKIPGIMTDIAKHDPNGFLKMVADQALGRTEEGTISDLPDAEYAVRQQYGDAIVDKSLEMFPLEKKESAITIIRPEERIQPTETITIKPQENAIPQQIAEQVDVGQQARAGEGVGQGDTQPEIPPREEGETQGQIAGQEAEMIGITHEQMNQVARELGLPDYEGDPETVAGWDFEANKRIQTNPNAIPELLNKMRDGKQPDAVEQRMMLKYMADLKARINKDPMNDGLLNQWKRARHLSDIVGGREVAKSLRARQASVPVEETLADYIVRQMEVSQVDRLTEKQKETNIREYEEFKKAQKNWDTYNAKRIEELATKKAEEMLKETKAKSPKSKRSNEDYAKERQQLIDDIKKKWKDASRGNLGASFVPYAKELAAIAPDVAKLVKSLVEQGIDKLPDLINAVHAELKDVMDQITKEDVRALIAGEYNEKKRTRSQITATIKDLKDEAALIGRLQQLEDGVEPKNERARIKRNQEIEALKQKIKEHDLTKLAATKSRLKSEISKLEKQLEEGNYAPEEKPNPVKLDEEGQKLKDRLIQLRKEREIRLAEEEYANRSKAAKAIDIISAPFREVRSLKASFDLSAPLRQGVIPTAAELVTNPARAGRRFVNMLKSAGSEKYMDRWMYDLQNSPEWKVMEESGLSISEPGKITKKEEVFQSRFAQKIPGVKGSERAYSFWLNAQRVDLFKKGAEMMTEKGMTFENSPEAYKNWAKTVNALTGRGELVGPFKNAAELLSMGFFSPRLIASRLSFFNPRFYKNIPAPVRMMVVKDLLKFIGLGTTVLALSKLGGAEVETDPRSPDFGKMKFGDTRYDIWGGFQQYIRLFSQLVTQSKKTSGGNVESLIKDDGSNKSGAVAGTFLRSKAAPLLGSIINVATGEDVVGQPVTLGSEAKRFLLPILWEDIYKAAKDEGVKGALATAIPGIVGVGVQTYQGTPSKPAKKPSRKNKKKTSRKKTSKSN